MFNVDYSKNLGGYDEIYLDYLYFYSVHFSIQRTKQKYLQQS